jgi:hypothetical protein
VVLSTYRLREEVLSVRQRTKVKPTASGEDARSNLPVKTSDICVIAVSGIVLIALLSLVVPSECSAVWFSEARLTDASGKSWVSHNNGRCIATGPDGIIHIVWNDARSGKHEIYYKSFDGWGWTPDERLTYSSRAASGVSIALDEAGTVHVVWHDYRDGNYEIYYKRHDQEGWSVDQRLTSAGGDSYNPSLAIGAAGNLHLVWHDKRDGNYEIYCKVYDGETWGPDERLTDFVTESSYASVAAGEGNEVHVVWQDQRDEHGRRIYYKHFDGLVWEDEEQLEADSTSGCDASIASGKDGSLHVVWMDKSNEIYYKEYDGTSWQPDLRLTTADRESGRPAITVDDSSNVHVAWQDARVENYEIYYKSRRNGVWSEDRRLTDFRHESVWPSIAADSEGNVHIIWSDWRTGDYEIFWRMWHPEALEKPGITSIEPAVWHSGEHLSGARITGTGFEYPDSVWMIMSNEPRLEVENLQVQSNTCVRFDLDMDGAGPGLWDVVLKNPDGQKDTLKSGFEVLPARIWSDEVRVTEADENSLIGPNRTMAPGPDGSLHLVWADFRHGQAEIYYNRLYGEWHPEIRLTESEADSYAPAIAVDKDGSIHVVWHENRDGDQQIYYKHHDGTAWGPDTALTATPSFSIEASIAADESGDVHIVWSDQRSGDREIYYKKLTQGTWSEDQRLTVSDGLSREPVIDTDAGGRLHIAWIDARDGHGEIYYKMHNGNGWEADQRLTDLPEIPASIMLEVGTDSSVHLVWSDNYSGEYRLYYLRKAGEVWDAIESLTGAGGLATHEPCVAIDVNNGVNVFYCGRPRYVPRGRDQEIYRLYNPGEGWSGPERRTESGGSAQRPRAAVDASGTLHLVWTDERNGNGEVYHVYRSPDPAPPPAVMIINPSESDNLCTTEAIISGDHFLRDPDVWLSLPGEDRIYSEHIKRLSTSDIACRFRLVGASPGEWAVNVRNIDEQTGTLQGGFHISDTPWGVEGRLTSSPGHSLTAANNARCLAWDSDGEAHVVWHDERDGSYEIYYRKGNGRVWGEEVRLTDNGVHSRSPSIVAGKNGSLHVCWNDELNETWEVSYRKFANGTWGETIPLSRLDGTDSEYPCLTVDSEGNPFVFYQDRWERQAILCSRWDGNQWHEEVIADGGKQPPRRPTATSDTLGNVYVFWSMGGYDTYNIHYRRWADSAWYYSRELFYSPDNLTRATCATDSSGRMMIVCREGAADWRLRSLLFDGRDWVDISDTSLVGYEPYLCADGEGRFHLMTTCGTNECENTVIYRCFDRAWSEPVELNGLREAMQPFIASDAAGNLAVVWEDYRHGESEIYWRYYDAPDDTTEIVTPKRFGIRGIVPNPVITDAEVRFGLISRSRVKMAVYDITGRLVYKDDLGVKDPGFHYCHWSCRNSSGRRVSPGIYLVRIEASDNEASAKIIVLR